jgi:hypothetical protein
MNSLKHTPLPGLDIMVLVLVVWLCALPFIGFLVVPIFGISTAIGTALALLIAMLLLCWGSCVLAVLRFYREEKTKTIVSARAAHPLLCDEQHSGKDSQQLG